MASIDEDFALALQLQEEENNNNDVIPKTDIIKSNQEPVSVVDQSWELIDPNPDIHALFLEFNKKYFWSKLLGCEVRWSPRMTLCAGLCCYEGFGGLCSIRLSLPLLKLRPRKDLIQTLLHEMIHAYLFVTHNRRDREDHGPEFCKHMYRINKESGAHVTIYHTFIDEVKFYQQHWWKCNGPCQSRHPYYGLVKRAMNRAPGPNDIWWREHQLTCGGTFTKIKEPEQVDKKRKYDAQSPGAPQKKKTKVTTLKNFIPFSGSGFTLGNETRNDKINSPGNALGSLKIKNSNSNLLYNKSPAQKHITNFLVSPSKTNSSKDVLNREKLVSSKYNNGSFTNMPSSSKNKNQHNSFSAKSNGQTSGALRQRQNSSSTVIIHAKKNKNRGTASKRVFKISELPVPAVSDETLTLRQLLRRKWSLDSNNDDALKESQKTKERRHSFCSNAYRIKHIVTSDSESEEFLKRNYQNTAVKDDHSDENSDEDDLVFLNDQDKSDQKSLITKYFNAETVNVQKEKSFSQEKTGDFKHSKSDDSSTNSRSPKHENMKKHIFTNQLNKHNLKPSTVTSNGNSSTAECLLVSEWDKIKIVGETKSSEVKHPPLTTNGNKRKASSSNKIFQSTNSSTDAKKSPSPMDKEEVKPSNNSQSLLETNEPEYCECPLCNKPIKFNLINDHLDECIVALETKNSKEETEIIAAEGNSSEPDVAQASSNNPHESQCSESSFTIGDVSWCDCPVCQKLVPLRDINSHLDLCISSI